MAFPTTAILDNFTRANENPLQDALGGTPVSFPSTGILDSFTRADENPLSDGGLWTSKLFASDATLKLASNQVLQTSAVECSNWWNQNSFGPDCEVYVTIATLPSSGNIGAVYCRTANEGTASFNAYCIKYTNQGSSQFNIAKVSAGSTTSLASFTQAISAGDAMGISAVSTLLTAYARASGIWSSLGSFTDATFSSAGHLGLLGGDVASALVAFTNFGGGTTNTQWSTTPARTTHPNMWQLLSNQAAMVVNGNTSQYWVGSSFGPDTEVYADLVAISTEMGLYSRAANENTSSFS